MAGVAGVGAVGVGFGVGVGSGVGLPGTTGVEGLTAFCLNPITVFLYPTSYSVSSYLLP